MILRYILHFVGIFVFLIGSTFSCATIINDTISYAHHAEEISHTMHDHDCCPEDGHEKESNLKNLIQIINTQNLKIISVFLKNSDFAYQEIIQYRYTHTIYQSPMYDRQSFFFTDTIRFLT